MNAVKQFSIIMVVSLVGEVLKAWVPLPVPASIYGMVILFFCLMTGIIKLESVKNVSHFLIEIMPVMFIPAGVGLMSSWGVLSPMLIPVSVITLATIITVMGVSGRVSQFMIRKEQKGREKE